MKLVRRFSRPWFTVAVLLLFGGILLIPTWIVLPRDDEGLFTTIAPTVFQAKHLFDYPFWDPFVGFGVPQPGSEELIFHPFVLFARWAELGFSIALLYQVQLWIGLASVWALCRRLGMRGWISLLCGVTFALCAATVDYLIDFWPDPFVLWTLVPLLVLLLVKLLDSEERWSRAVYSVSAGLCAGLMFLDGHAGVFPSFAIGIVAFVIGRPRRAFERWPWLLAGLGVFALTVSTKVLDVGLENARTAAGSHRPQQVYDMDFARLFLYPFHGGDHGFRLIAIGGPFVVLAIVGLVWRGVSQQHANGLRLATGITFLAWFFPAHSVSALTGNWYFGQSFSFFAIVLAGTTAQALWTRFPAYRLGLLAVGALQVAVMVWGFYPTYRGQAERASDYAHGRPAASLKNTFENQPLYTYFEQRPDHASTRVYMAARARDRLWRTLVDYHFVGWQLHGLRLVNGHFRGIDVHELQQQKETLHGEIRGEPSLWAGVPDTLQEAGGTLDVLNVGYVLAVPGERVASSLVPLRRFRLADGSVIVVYANPRHWPDAVVLSPDAKRLDTLPASPGCELSGLLCDDFAAVRPLRRPAGVLRQEWHGTSLEASLAPSPSPGVLMVSQMYRPGWRARLSDGRTVNGYRLFGGLTGFDLPPGIRSAVVSFHPTARIVFASISWATVGLGLLFVIAVPPALRRRRASAEPGGARRSSAGLD